MKRFLDSKQAAEHKWVMGSLGKTAASSLSSMMEWTLRFSEEAVIIRLTQKLGDKIGVRPSRALPRDPNPFADWTAHLFTAQRTQYILLANTATLYSMVMFGRGITHEGVFLNRAFSLISEYMADDGGDFLYQRLIAPSTHRIRFSKTGDRRVLGSINELVFQAKCHLQDDELSPYDVAERLNKTPLSILNADCPRNAFQTLRVDETMIPTEEGIVE